MGPFVRAAVDNGLVTRSSPIIVDASLPRQDERGITCAIRTPAAAVEGLQPYHVDSAVGAHLWMLHLICNIDKHRYVNVVNLHSIANAHLRGDDVPETLTHGMKLGLGLLTYLQGTGYEDRVEIDVITDVCFRDRELEEAGPGYGSRIENEGINRPPVASVLSSCLKAVNEVVAMLTKDVGCPVVTEQS